MPVSPLSLPLPLSFSRVITLPWELIFPCNIQCIDTTVSSLLTTLYFSLFLVYELHASKSLCCPYLHSISLFDLFALCHTMPSHQPLRFLFTQTQSLFVLNCNRPRATRDILSLQGYVPVDSPNSIETYPLIKFGFNVTALYHRELKSILESVFSPSISSYQPHKNWVR